MTRMGDIKTLCAAGASGISYLMALQLPNIQEAAYLVAIGSGTLSMANMVFGWIKAHKNKRKNGKK